MELPKMDRPRIVDLALIAMMDMCGCQSKVGVRKKPRYLIVEFLVCCVSQN